MHHLILQDTELKVDLLSKFHSIYELLKPEYILCSIQLTLPSSWSVLA
jgi:hypothetical protein